eukprot:TRINITY_DN828_c0_g1_i2.p1 TRINITY_DN828_c0_g1~~TRINITY_DN828_c0_g1_i2.p1  ORF type:complete len:214 (+),score=53.28 TRINITY_DN828_c0_g1_i2:512-1153(+)
MDESLLTEPSLLHCTGCADALDHSQHNVCWMTPKDMLNLLSESGTPVVSLQTGQPITPASGAPAEAPAKEAPSEAANAQAAEKEEVSFASKQLQDVTNHIVAIEANDKSATTYDFAHKIHYLKADGPPMFARLLEALKTNTMLTTLYLGCNDLGDAGAAQVVEALTGNRTLQHLYLQYNGIGDAGMQSICSLLGSDSGLCSLYLYGNLSLIHI